MGCRRAVATDADLSLRLGASASTEPDLRQVASNARRTRPKWQKLSPGRGFCVAGSVVARVVRGFCGNNPKLRGEQPIGLEHRTRKTDSARNGCTMAAIIEVKINSGLIKSSRNDV